MTVLEAIQRSTEFLAKKGVDSARLQTELLLADLLKLPRMQLYLNFERALTETEVDSFRELIRRRGGREPLQHIIGSTSFCGYEISVSQHVLVPRQETEILAEHGWTFLNQLESAAASNSHSNSNSNSNSTSGPQSPAALDFGTGSGCLAIALASKCSSAHVDAVDISLEALDVARQNAARHGLAERIGFFHGNGFDALPRGARFDLIISNPPYVPSAEIETLQREVRDFDPRPALDGGPDGLDFYRRLAAHAAPFLCPHGKLMLEFGDGQAPPITHIFEQQNWIVEATYLDYNQKARILVARRACTD